MLHWLWSAEKLVRDFVVVGGCGCVVIERKNNTNNNNNELKTLVEVQHHGVPVAWGEGRDLVVVKGLSLDTAAYDVKVTVGDEEVMMTQSVSTSQCWSENWLTLDVCRTAFLTAAALHQTEDHHSHYAALTYPHNIDIDKILRVSQPDGSQYTIQSTPTVTYVSCKGSPSPPDVTGAIFESVMKYFPEQNIIIFTGFGTHALNVYRHHREEVDEEKKTLYCVMFGAVVGVRDYLTMVPYSYEVAQISTGDVDFLDGENHPLGRVWCAEGGHITMMGEGDKDDKSELKELRLVVEGASSRVVEGGDDDKNEPKQRGEMTLRPVVEGTSSSAEAESDDDVDNNELKELHPVVEGASSGGDDKNELKECEDMTLRYALELLPRGSVCPVVEGTSLRVVGGHAEAIIMGKNLRYISRINVLVTDNEVQRWRCVVDKKEMGRVVGVVGDPIMKWGKTSKLSVECVAWDGRVVTCDNIKITEEFADCKNYEKEYEVMDVGRLVKKVVQYSLLRDGEKVFVFEECPKLVGCVLNIVEIFEKNHAQEMARVLGLPSLLHLDKAQPHPITEYITQQYSADQTDEQIFQVLSTNVRHAVGVLEDDVMRFSCMFPPATQIAQLFLKTAATLGAVAALVTLNAGAAVCVPLLLVTAGKHTWTVAKGYENKVDFLLCSLKPGCDAATHPVHVKEVLLEQLTTSHVTMPLQVILEDVELFSNRFAALWDEIFSNEGDSLGLRYCAAPDRVGYGRLLWCVLAVGRMRKTLASLFVVQVVGETNCGKSTICKEVFHTKSITGTRISAGTMSKIGHTTPLHPVLRIIDSPGLSDMTAVGEKMIEPNYCILCTTEAGLRDFGFIVRLAVVLSSRVMFKVVVTKCDMNMDSNGLRGLPETCRENLVTSLELFCTVLTADPRPEYSAAVVMLDLAAPYLGVLMANLSRFTALTAAHIVTSASPTAMSSFAKTLHTNPATLLAHCKASNVTLTHDLLSIFTTDFASLGLVL